MWLSLPIHHLLQEMITTTGCSPSAPNQVVVKQQAASTTFMHTRLCYAHIPHLVGCQVLEYTKRLYPSLFFPQPGVSLPMLKASSDTVHWYAQGQLWYPWVTRGTTAVIRAVRSLPHWKPLLLDSRTAFKLRPLPSVLAWATSIYLTGHDLDSLTWLPSLT